jgi:hypothetical protein
MNNALPNANEMAKAEVRLPWYVIVGGMLIVTAIIMAVCAGPLDTAPDQEYDGTPAAHIEYK